MIFPLLELPEELIVNVINKLDDVQTLRSLAVTSSRLQALSEPSLYSSFQRPLRTPSQARRLVAALNTRPQRAKDIRTLDARWKSFDPIAFFDILSRARNLKDMVHESPFCNYGRWYYIVLLIRPGVAC